MTKIETMAITVMDAKGYVLQLPLVQSDQTVEHL
jgi:hypothetical protein